MSTSVHLHFPNLPHMAPYSTHGSPYALSLCGETVAEHLINNSPFADLRDTLRVSSDDPHWGEFSYERAEMRSGSTPIHANAFENSADPSENFTLTYPWQLLSFLEMTLKKRNVFGGAMLGVNVHVEGKVEIAETARISPGAVLIGDIYLGPHSQIGFHSVIRGPCAIEAGCQIGSFAEIKNAWIQRGASIGPTCYVGDSVIGENCVLGACTRTTNVRLDQKKPILRIPHEALRSESPKTGSFLGSAVRTGANVLFMPGTIVEDGAWIGPQVVVSGHLSAHRFYFVKQDIQSVEVGKALASMFLSTRG
jgi:acetyltransferase-like isoleucine patch superfamily enzyme